MERITIRWPREMNEHGRPMLWFGSWLVGDAGVEGEWFYSGRGGESQDCAVPAWATGLRVRRWPNEGLDAEYADLLAIAGAREVAPAALDFDTRQRYSLLAPDFE